MNTCVQSIQACILLNLGAQQQKIRYQTLIVYGDDGDDETLVIAIGIG